MKNTEQEKIRRIAPYSKLDVDDFYTAFIRDAETIIFDIYGYKHITQAQFALEELVRAVVNNYPESPLRGKDFWPYLSSISQNIIHDIHQARMKAKQRAAIKKRGKGVLTSQIQTELSHNTKLKASQIAVLINNRYAGIYKPTTAEAIKQTKAFKNRNKNRKTQKK